MNLENYFIKSKEIDLVSYIKTPQDNPSKLLSHNLSLLQKDDEDSLLSITKIQNNNIQYLNKLNNKNIKNKTQLFSKLKKSEFQEIIENENNIEFLEK